MTNPFWKSQMSDITKILFDRWFRHGEETLADYLRILPRQEQVEELKAIIAVIDNDNYNDVKWRSAILFTFQEKIIKILPRRSRLKAIVFFLQKRSEHGFPRFFCSNTLFDNRPDLLVSPEKLARLLPKRVRAQYLEMIIQEAVRVNEFGYALRAAHVLGRKLETTEVNHFLERALSKRNLDTAIVLATRLGRHLSEDELIRLIDTENMERVATLLPEPKRSEILERELNNLLRSQYTKHDEVMSITNLLGRRLTPDEHEMRVKSTLKSGEIKRVTEVATEYGYELTQEDLLELFANAVGKDNMFRSAVKVLCMLKSLPPTELLERLEEQCFRWGEFGLLVMTRSAQGKEVYWEDFLHMLDIAHEEYNEFSAAKSITGWVEYRMGKPFSKLEH